MKIILAIAVAVTLSAAAQAQVSDDVWGGDTPFRITQKTVALTSVGYPVATFALESSDRTIVAVCRFRSTKYTLDGIPSGPYIIVADLDGTKHWYAITFVVGCPDLEKSVGKVLNFTRIPGGLLHQTYEADGSGWTDEKLIVTHEQLRTKESR